jgi:hypothetical protein
VRIVKSEDSIQNKMDCYNVVCSKGSPLHGHSVEDTPQKGHMHSVFNNIDGSFTLKEDRKSEVDNILKEGQNYKNCDDSGVGIKDGCIINEDVHTVKESKCSDKNTCFALLLAKAETTTEKYCNVTENERSINSRSLKFGKVLNGDGQCGRKSADVETNALLPNVPNTVSCGRESVLWKNRENTCNTGGNEEGSDDRMSSELLIETESSQDISVDTAAVYHHNDLPQVNSCCREVYISSFINPLS